MGTLSWLRQDNGYEVFFNRDELKTRGPEQPPEIRMNRYVRFISPVDSDSGGTWIAVNGYGLTLCLVNLYTDQVFNATTSQSRGMIVPVLISCRDLTEVQNALNFMPLTSFRPFRLAGFAPDASVMLAVWDGKILTVNPQADDQCPVVSSSFKTKDVEKSRRDYFKEIFNGQNTPDVNILEAYHKSRCPELGAYSVCMERADAKTMSFCRVKVNPFMVRFVYESDPVNPGSGDQKHIWDMNIQTKEQGTAA